MIADDRRATAAHESAHVIGTRWLEPETRLLEVWIDGREPGTRGKTSVEHPWDSPTGPDLAAAIVVALLGWEFDSSRPREIGWPPSYEEAKDDVGGESLATLIRLGNIDESTYYTLARLAVETAADVRFRVEHAIIAEALYQRGRLTALEIDLLLSGRDDPTRR
jgi:hypothetical protein